MALTQITGSGIAIGAKPNVAFQVQATDTDQVISGGSQTKIQWESVELDTSSYWDSTNNRYRPQVAGWYMFFGMVRVNFYSPPAGVVNNLVYKNGSSYQTLQIQMTTDYFTNGNYPFPSVLVLMNGSSDYVEMFFESDEQVTLHDSASTPSRFGGFLVHPT
tara:strand:- start:36 stop:518 length:483 start_codon:yes stop_codon:yes gene_type:complete